MTLTFTLIDHPATEGITTVDFNIFTAHYAIEPDPSYSDSYKYYITLYETIVVTAMIQLTICVDEQNVQFCTRFNIEKFRVRS